MDPLTTYFRDHLAGAQAAIDLLEVLRDQHLGTPLGQFAAGLLAEVEEDREALRGQGPVGSRRRPPGWARRSVGSGSAAAPRGNWAPSRHWKPWGSASSGSGHSGGPWRWSPGGMTGYAAWIFITWPHVPTRSTCRWKSGAWKRHRRPCARPRSNPPRRRPQMWSRCGSDRARLMRALTPGAKGLCGPHRHEGTRHGQP
jgi:hypothetical protein